MQVYPFCFRYCIICLKSDGSTEKTGYLNAGLRWVFAGQLEIDLYFRNLVGDSGSPERSSRALSFVFYDSF